uniref:Uncharacterized protein n=1 Tax=Arundo donax TaxID=35708 RepID=A0A0A9BNK6_ARUDO
MGKEHFFSIFLSVNTVFQTETNWSSLVLVPRKKPVVCRLVRKDLSGTHAVKTR